MDPQDPNSSRKRQSSPQPSTSRISPPSKRKCRALSDTEKLMVYRLYTHVYNEKFDAMTREQDVPGEIHVNKNECVLKTSEILGISRTTVFKVLKEHKENENFSVPMKTEPKIDFKGKLDEFTFAAICRKVHMFYENNDPPTLAKVLQVVNDDEDLPNFSLSNMRRILKHLNFQYVHKSRRSMLIDRQDIISWRRNYLQKIKDYRSKGLHIYYQDETWVNEGHTLKKAWTDMNVQTSRQAFLEGLTTGLKAPSGKGRRLIISHIGSGEGFVEGGLLMFTSKSGKADYHQDMNGDCFEEWFRGILPKLNPGSVIVLDNAPYHSRKIDTFPNMSWNKSKIVEWMNTRNLSFPRTATKSDMIDIALPTKPQCDEHVIDEMAREQGFTILRLPPYHCELNPIELIWAQAKGHVARNNKTFKLEDVKNLFLQGLELITAERWKDCENHIINTENKMLQLDHLADSVTDRFIISVTDESEDDEITEPDSE